MDISGLPRASLTWFWGTPCRLCWLPTEQLKHAQMLFLKEPTQSKMDTTMGRMMILGEAKCQNTFWWDFSPKHNLEDENIKCYKACVMSPSKTHSIVLFCKIWGLQISCSKPTMASLSQEELFWPFPKDAVTGSCHTCHLIHNNKPFTLGDNEVDSWRTVHTAIWANHRKDQIWLVTH